MKKISIILLFIVIIAQSAVVTGKEKMRIAVMDLKSEAVSKKTVNAISNLLRTELINIGSFMVIERGQMDSILKEQGLQQTGCTDQTCVVEMGKILSARKVLVGEVSSMGKAILMTIRIVDVEKGVSEFGSSEKADSEDNLDRAVYNIAQKLASKIEGRKEEYVAPPVVAKKPEPEVKKPEPQVKKPELTASAVDSKYYLRGIVPGWAQIYSGHTTKGIAIGGIFLASTIWTLVAILNYNNSKDDYNSLGVGLSQDKYNSAYDKYKKNAKIATYSIIGVSLIYVVNWVDVIFFSKPDSGMSLGMIKYDNMYVYFNVSRYSVYDRSTGLRTDLSVTTKF